MHRTMTTLTAVALAAVVAIPAAASQTGTIEVRLTDTLVAGAPLDPDDLVPGGVPGVDWSSDDVWHLRRLPVAETMRDIDGQEVGTLERSVSFNLDLGDGSSTAWCSFKMSFDDSSLGDFDGRCGGSLIEGTVVGRGGAGQLRGVYELEPGGIPGVGPYILRLDVRER